MNNVVTTIPTPVLGRSLSAREAGDIINNYVAIKTATAPIIKQSAGVTDAAKRYYCGREGFEPQNEDLAFLFTRESIGEIMNRIDANAADGMILYNGAWTDEQVNDSASTLPEQPGKPTLVMFPFKFNATVTAAAVDGSDITILLDDGFEHPGTIGDGDLFTSVAVPAGDLEL